MKKSFKILLGVLLVAVVAAASLVVWQRKNIALLRTASQYSQEELQEQIAGNQEKVQETIDSHAELVVRDLTDEEKIALREGSISQDELVGLMTGGEAGSDETQTSNETAKPSDEQSTVESTSLAADPKPEGPTYEQQLSALVAQAYILRENFQNQLTEIENEAKAEYRALPKKERTRAKLIDLAFSYYDRLVAMESECDKAMNELVTEMRTLIKENNGDMSIADTMLQAYEDEKELKKAWYFSQLESRGL